MDGTPLLSEIRSLNIEYMTVRTCKDTSSAVKGVPPALAFCKTFVFEQKSIEASAHEAGVNLAAMYSIFVLLGVGWVLMVGSFTSSRRAFRASLAQGSHA